MNQKQGTKKGLSPGVLLLLLITLLTIVVIFILQRKPEAPLLPPQGETSTSSDKTVSQVPTVSYPTPPVNPPDAPDENVTLSVQSKSITFNSGGEILYGYPTLTIKDDPETALLINKKLTLLVEEKILPIIEQMAIDDTPDAYRSYHFSLQKGSGFYSIVVTVDISEGITSAREIYGWNFLSDTGEYVTHITNCYDKESFANIIDSCLENVASYDQIIHEWLENVVTNEYETNEFSFYFENENMIAVLNKRLRINFFDRDPILITVPYEKIEKIFPNYSIN